MGSSVVQLLVSSYSSDLFCGREGLGPGSEGGGFQGRCASEVRGEFPPLCRGMRTVKRETNVRRCGYWLDLGEVSDVLGPFLLGPWGFGFAEKCNGAFEWRACRGDWMRMR